MEIQNPNTPPKRKQISPHSPSYDTPPKNARKNKPPSPSARTPSPPKKENPESRHQLSRRKEVESNRKPVSAFHITRLEQDYIYERELGMGHFSSVCLYRSRLTGECFAIKVAKADTVSLNEAQALGTLSLVADSCPYIVRYFHSWVEQGVLYLVMEYCQSSLGKLIETQRRQGTRFGQKQVINMMRQALRGLACLHKQQIVHLDIKPDNLLIRGDQIKIADLGLCRARRLRLAGEPQQGDSRYLAKEVLNYHSQLDLTKADVYSLGLTFVQVLTLQSLPNNGEQWVNMREKGIDIRCLVSYSEGVLRLLQEMTHIDWRKRPSAEELLNNSVLREQRKGLSGKGSNRKRESSR